MELQTEKTGKYSVTKAKGRLDAAWSDYFTDIFLNYVRNGDHHIVIDAGEMEFLSSAGIRSLLRINKEIALVKGSFLMVNANEFVSKTLMMTGFGKWLSDTLPDGLLSVSAVDVSERNPSLELYIVNAAGSMELSITEAWQAWNSPDRMKVSRMAFPANQFALGVGSTSTTTESASGSLGEFMAICGNLAYLEPEEKGRPDYLLPAGDFIPEMLVANALVCKGEMSSLFRFSPQEGKPALGVSDIAAQVLSITESKVACFVIMAEISGLVGANLVRSPGKIGNEPVSNLMELKEWLSFSGERVFSGEQGIVFGIVSKTDDFVAGKLLRKLPSNPELSAHMHAVVFPYQPLPNGNIDLKLQVDKFFGGAPPIALLHLVDDNRTVQGLGESSFIRGACWCSPIKNKEGIL